MENSNQIIREAEGVLVRYKKFKEKSSRAEYLEDRTKFQICFFVIINRLIHIIQSRNYHIFTEGEKLKNLFRQYSQIYFDRFQLEGFHDTSWHLLLKQQFNNSKADLYLSVEDLNSLLYKNMPINYTDYGFTFFEPQKFNEDYCKQIYKKLFDNDDLVIKHISNQEIHFSVSFRLAIAFAKIDGFYSLINDNKFKRKSDSSIYNGRALCQELFADEFKKFVTDMNFTLNNEISNLSLTKDSNREKHIFYKLKNNLVFKNEFSSYLKKKNIKTHPDFKNKLKEYKIIL